MNPDRELLHRIEALPEPRHLFILPDWADPAALDQLIDQGFLSCIHQQRDEKGLIHVAMGLKVTPKGSRLIHSELGWGRLLLRGSLAGASLAGMSVVILYLG